MSRCGETRAESVARMDKDVVAVLDAVAARGKPTVVVLLADHGETLDDNGELLHGAGFFQSVSHVPLIIQLPNQTEPKTVSALVSQADLLPTMVDLVGAVIPAAIDGISAAGLLDGSAKAIRSTALVEGDPSWTGHGTLPGAVISPPWTMLRQHFPCAPGEKNERPPPAPGEPLGEPLVNTCLFNIRTTPAVDQHAVEPDVVQQPRNAGWSIGQSRPVPATGPRPLHGRTAAADGLRLPLGGQ